MKILLDNNVPPKLALHLSGHHVRHVRDLGWSSLLNGELVAKAGEQFDLLVTADKNMEFQTSLSGTDICVAVLDCRSNRLEDLQPLMPVLLANINQLVSETYTRIRL